MELYVDEMPDCCVKCPLCKADYKGELYCAQLDESFKENIEAIDYKKRKDNCPLKSLAEHDAEKDAEIERLREQLHTANQETLHFQNKYFAEKQIAIEELDKVKQQLFKSFDGIGLNTYCEKVKPVESYIDQQIKSLTGDK